MSSSSKIIRIDFETRSRVDLKKVGAWIYSKHPSTEILCMAYQVDNKNPQLWIPSIFDKKGIPCPLTITPQTIVEAHNAFFEQCIWNNICVVRFDWPVITNWQCSAAKAAYHALPRSLNGVASALDLDEQKDDQGHRVMLQLTKPRKPTKNNPAHWFHSDEKYDQLYKYCLQDVKTEMSVSKALCNLPNDEKEIWGLDQTINFRGVHADREVIKGALFILDKLTKEADKEIRKLTNDKVETINQTAKIKEYLNQLGCDLESIGRPVLEKFLENNPDVNSVAKQIIDLRLRASKSSTKKYKAMLDRMDNDNRIRELVLYHGAITGRWTGLGIQIQNFPKGTIKSMEEIEIALDAIKRRDIALLKLLFGDPMEAISSCLRAVLCAAPGYELIAADYAAIEARVLLWLVGDTKALNSLRQGKDLYVELASLIFSKPEEYITKKERFLGKSGVLGCGYQMWYPKFQKTCASMGHDISNELAKKAVTTYRDRFVRVVVFWKHIEMHIIQAVSEQRCLKWFPLEFDGTDPDWLQIQLPSNRRLHYYKPKIGFDTQRKKPRISYMGMENHKWTRVHTYGGKLTENVVQAIARDLLADAMLRLERAGFPIILTIHDEVVAEVKKETKTLKEFCDIMKTKPSWAEGLPIEVKGWKGHRFRK